MFILVYHTGLTGSQAIWANHKYYDHCTLHPEIIVEVKHSVIS